MNASQIKAMSWLTAAGLTVGLSYYVWDFVSTLSERQNPVEADEVRAKLTPDSAPSARTDALVSYDDVMRGFQEFNWTGMPPAPPPSQVDSVDVPDSGPGFTPIGDLLSIQMIKEDTRNSAGSSVYIKYKAASGVIDSKPADEHLRIGDRLLSPHQYIELVRISVAEGVVFSFDDKDRKEEILSPREFDPNTEIVKVGPGGVQIPQRQSSIPMARADSVYKPNKTTQVGEGKFIIGTEDELYISEHFSKILSSDVRHKRHIDPKTGKFDGIELKSVKAGSVAERHGAQAGDIIKSINGHPVTSLNEAVTYAKNNSEKFSTWIIEVENKGKTRTVTYETPSN
jgi:hypothetical protein